MKQHFITATLLIVALFAQGANNATTDSSKAAFYSAFTELKNMLEGKDSLNYEKAVFITENAYYGNKYSYDNFKKAIDLQVSLIETLAKATQRRNDSTYQTLKKHQKKMFVLNAANLAIFKYITDTTFYLVDSTLQYKFPFDYSTQDPYGTNQWENTQVLNLLTNNKGNCYALASLFKIFSDRLHSEARLVTTPHHIYIQNRNARGDFKNIELTTKTFPGDGSIQTLTYTTKISIMNGMAQQPLSDKQAIALNLIYLAKGFQHKFNDNSNDFILKCANLAFKEDTLSLGALLLKAEVTEKRLQKVMQAQKIKTLLQARKNTVTQKLLSDYEKQLSNLYKCGYREIPNDIQHLILSAMQGNKDGYITTDKTPNPFAELGAKQRYATLSGGLFDEVHPDVDTINYFNALLDTKHKKIIKLFASDTAQNNSIDPVVFAMSVDPLANKFPGESPYSAFGNNPILFVDEEGKTKTVYITTIAKDGTRSTEIAKVDKNYIEKINYGTQLNMSGYHNQYLVEYDVNVYITKDYRNSKDGNPSITAKSKLFERNIKDDINQTKEDLSSGLNTLQSNMTGKADNSEYEGEKGMEKGADLIDNTGKVFKASIIGAPVGEGMSLMADAMKSGLDFKNKDVMTAVKNTVIRGTTFIAGQMVGKAIDGVKGMSDVTKESIKFGADAALDKNKESFTGEQK